MTRVERRDPDQPVSHVTVAELEELEPGVRVESVFRQDWTARSAFAERGDAEIFPAMNAVIEKEDLAAWKAILRWHLVNANARYLSTAFVNENFEFFGKKLVGAEQLQPRWKRCVEDVDNDLGEALGQAYAEKYFSAESKQQALKMVKEIEAAMQQDIESLPWMSGETKKNALEKLHAVRTRLGIRTAGVTTASWRSCAETRWAT